MAAFQRFDDILAWQKARELTKTVYAVTADGSFAREFGLRDQIRRASVSIMANIAEGSERGTNREFHRFLSMAKSSSAEVRSHLYVAVDIELLSNECFAELRAQAEEIGRMISGLMKHLRKPRPAP